MARQSEETWREARIGFSLLAAALVSRAALLTRVHSRHDEEVLGTDGDGALTVGEQPMTTASWRTRDRVPIRVWYRYTDKPSAKPRPPWFSKRVCLLSLLDALGRVADNLVSLVVVADGPLSDETRRLLDGKAKVVELSHGGKCRSFAEVLRLALADGRPGELAYFAEDDYLYAPDAFSSLLEAVAERPDVDYFTLYDHPDRYGSPERAAARKAAGHAWYEAPSTCLTFAARTEALRRDRWGFYTLSRAPGLDSRRLRSAAVRIGWRKPLDHLSWRLVLRQRHLPPWTRARRPRLLAPVPGLATHCELDVVSAAVDWSAIASWLA